MFSYDYISFLTFREIDEEAEAQSAPKISKFLTKQPKLPKTEDVAGEIFNNKATKRKAQFFSYRNLRDTDELL